MDGREELWKKIIDTHRMSPPGHSPMGLLKWRRVFSIGTGATMTAVGLLLTAALGYSVSSINKNLSSINKNPEVCAEDVAKASVE